jgi:hypothetical protein
MDTEERLLRNYGCAQDNVVRGFLGTIGARVDDERPEVQTGEFHVVGLLMDFPSIGLMEEKTQGRG